MLGALGKIKRMPGFSGRRSWGMMGTKSLPSAPKPWSQMTEQVGLGAVSSSMDGSMGIMTF
jgi:hypothetical protein